MIGTVAIKNYKSIQDLELDLGRVTVLIGANGCGKSNILEAIAFCSAAAANKLDQEFLVSRGMRVPDDSRLMRSAFDASHVSDDIKVSVSTHVEEAEKADNSTDVSSTYECVLHNDGKSPYSTWTSSWFNEALTKLGPPTRTTEYLKRVESKGGIKLSDEAVDELLQQVLRQRFQYRLGSLSLQDFLIYSPENSSLRTFETEGQIQPLGIKGEGLFKLLTVLSMSNLFGDTDDSFSMSSNLDQVAEIKERLTLLDWFEDFEVVSGLSTGERNLNIKDKYLDDDFSYFTQKSANEGFLFLLFYFTLFISRETPSFFAIDNIDASLNPKLCSRLLTELADLAKTHEKQAIVTTHNPAVLDGLNLNDDEQRLFVIYRNKLGHTKAKRIFKQEVAEGQSPVPLSEAFLRGYLGGLPRNF